MDEGWLDAVFPDRVLSLLDFQYPVDPEGPLGITGQAEGSESRVGLTLEFHFPHRQRYDRAA